MTKSLQHEISPRGLRREQAAAYVGVGTTKFDEMVGDGRMPSPKTIDARRVWDRFRLDACFDNLMELDESQCGVDPFEGTAP